MLVEELLQVFQKQQQSGSQVMMICWCFFFSLSFLFVFYILMKFQVATCFEGAPNVLFLSFPGQEHFQPSGSELDHTQLRQRRVV